MMEEPQFFDEGGRVVAFARHTDPDTSHWAAEEVTPHLRPLQAAVLDYAARCGAYGFIDPDLNSHFATHASTYRTRRAELVDRGLIADTGERRTLAETGRKHAVWRITPKGMAAADNTPPDLAA